MCFEWLRLNGWPPFFLQQRPQLQINYNDRDRKLSRFPRIALAIIGLAGKRRN